jgi:lipopolysaccharide transport system permease protein
MTIETSLAASYRTATRLIHLFAPNRSALVLRHGLGTIWDHRGLCRELIRRDLAGQYAGQALGSFWIFGHPLFLLLIYIFVFVLVLKVKVPADASMPRDYTNYILAGIVPWLTISQALARAPMALLAQSNLVKQVIFPVEVLPPVSVIVSLVPMAVGVPSLAVYQILTDQGPPVTLLLAPIVLCGMFLFLTGLAYCLSAVTPFCRDLKDVVTVFITAGVYLIPAFYLPAWVPSLFEPIIILNPFSYPVLVCQDMLYYGRIEHPQAWLVFFATAVASFIFGYRLFYRLRPFIATVI